VVIISGLVEGGIPRHPPSDMPEAEADAFMEEQRRLFYVGITRVKADPQAGRPGRLILSHVMTAPTEIVMRSGLKVIAHHGGYSSVLASRFLSEFDAPEGESVE
jgi:superfamily I DNA/RNA helicase